MQIYDKKNKRTDILTPVFHIPFKHVIDFDSVSSIAFVFSIILFSDSLKAAIRNVDITYSYLRLIKIQ